MRKKLVSLGLALTMLCTLFTVSPNVNAAENSFALYYALLEELNEELGTDYIFPTAEQMEDIGESYDDLVKFYTAMNTDEFRDYVMKAHENAIKENNISDLNNILESEYEIDQIASV